MMKDFKTATDVTETKSSTLKIQLLHTMLHENSLRELFVLASQVGITTNGRLKLIDEDLLGYFVSSTHSTSRNAT